MNIQNNLITGDHNNLVAIERKEIVLMTKENRARWSIFTFVLGGALGLIALLLRGPVPLPNVDVESWAMAVIGENYFTAQVLTIFAYVIPFFGFWAVYDFLAGNERVEKLAFWGFMTAIIGTSLAIATLGVFSFVSPYLAEEFMLGNPQAPGIITQVATGRPAAINILGGTLYLLGTVLLGIAIWRGEGLPKWSGILLAAHGVSLVFGFIFYPLLLVSWIFILIAGLWMFIKYDPKLATRFAAK